MSDDELLNTEEAAALLRMPASSLRYWRHNGTGPRSFKMGPRRVVYRRSDLDAWIASQYEATSVGSHA